MARIESNGIAIEYDCAGPDGGVPVVLISGLGTQMIRWAEPFRQALAARGCRVIRFDNRDAGLSTHLSDAPVPDFAAVAGALARGARPDVPYTLHDMAADTIGLLDALSIDAAHVAGRSMGGMIGQLVASRYPDRVLSLTSIMSSTGNPGLPPAAPDVMAMMMAPAPDPRDDETGFLAHGLAFARRIAGPGFPFDEATWRDQLRAEYRRAHDPAGAGRQIAAIAATGDLRARLKRLDVPALVVHGSDDPLIPPACGKDTAANIPGAELMIVDGMGHDLPSALHEPLADAIQRTARRGRGAA